MAKISNYKFQLRGTLIVGGSSVSISNDLETEQAVVFTDEAVLLYNRDKTIIERVRASATGGTLTLLKRGMENDSETEDSGLEKERREGSYGAMTVFAPQIVDLLTYNELRAGISGGDFTDTTERDSVLGADGVATEPYTGVYVRSTSLHYNYNLGSGQRETVETGTATPNASQVVAGKKEDPTDAEFTAGTDVGSTGATMSPTPSQVAKLAQSNGFVYAGASAVGTDAYAVTMTPTLTVYTTGMSIVFLADVANTGACSINIDSLGVKNIKNLNGDDPADNEIKANQLVQVIYDGTDFVLQNSNQLGLNTSNIAINTSDIADLAIVITAGTNTSVQSSDAQVIVSETVYTKKKDIDVALAGTYTVSYTTAYFGGTSGTYTTRIYVDGVAVGTENTGESTFSEPVTITAGQNIQVYAKTSNATRTFSITNFRITCNFKPVSLTGTVVL